MVQMKAMWRKPKKERENVTVLEDKDGVINENAFSRVGEMHQTEIWAVRKYQMSKQTNVKTFKVIIKLQRENTTVCDLFVQSMWKI